MKDGNIKEQELQQLLSEQELNEVENYWWFIATHNWVVCGS